MNKLWITCSYPVAKMCLRCAQVVYILWEICENPVEKLRITCLYIRLYILTLEKNTCLNASYPLFAHRISNRLYISYPFGSALKPLNKIDLSTEKAFLNNNNK